MTGLYAVIAIQAALRQREATGRGQHIDMALLDVMVGTLANQAMNYLVSGQSPHRIGMSPPQHHALRRLPDRRRLDHRRVGNDAQFERFADLLDLPASRQWATNAGRVADRARCPGDRAQTPRLGTRRAACRPRGAGHPRRPDQHRRQALDRPADRRARDGARPRRGLKGLRTPIRFSDAELALGKRSPKLGGGE
jgi:crotonobetainyl-CoA:carnitine CoA-transferase CaiB-like acyl-CoA transferase